MSEDPVRVVTFGCRLNAYESEVMREHARATQAGHPTIIVNTCAVTAEAERQVRQSIRRLRRDNPDARIVVTGCAVQVDPERYGAMTEIDQVLGNAEKMRPGIFDPQAAPRIQVTDIMQVTETAQHLVSGFDGRARAFLEIQQGCDHRCTFCIIPFGRGPNRAVPMGHIVDQARHLVDQGFSEIVLTGVDITAYGGDLPGRPGLGQMIRRLLAQLPDLPRLRLSSLDPVEVDADLLAVIADEPRLMPHFHLSVQAGADLILKRMKRRHLRADVIRLAGEIRRRRPDAALGADIIAGFPTEDEDMFRQSLDLVDEAGLTHLHVFPFSSRPGTPAARMRKVPGDQVKDRAARLRAKGEAAMAAFLGTWPGRTVSVLVEKDNQGFSEHYLPVKLDRAAPEGALVRAWVTGIDGAVLVARQEEGA